MTDTTQKLQRCEVVKTDASKRLVFGFALVCTEKSEEYNDLQDEYIPEDVMFDAALDFALKGAPADEMHDEEDRGHYPFLFPLTADIAKALGIETPRTGLLVGARFDEPTFKRFESGELTAFSIGGTGIVVEEEVA